MMRFSQRKNVTGFTLLEMMLVMVIIASIMVLITNYGTHRMDQFKRDRAALQMQQILAAGLSYYVNNGRWPASLAALQPAYLPAGNAMTSPYANSYVTGIGPSSNFFTVAVTAFKPTDAQIIAAQLPLATVAGSTVTTQVVIPGQNLNNARSVNFAGIYLNGGCVPVPTCPGNMTPSIYVSPVAVSGVYDAPTTGQCPGGITTCSNIVTYPINSFTAYAGQPSSVPTACNGSSGTSCTSTDPSVSPPPIYWRVCLSVITEKGVVGPPSSGTFHEQILGSILAITRCVPAGGDVPKGNSL